MTSAAADALPLAPDASGPAAVQRVVHVRRRYNSWVAAESLEDYALRFTPRAFRRWTPGRVANTAFGAASFLVLEAVGATLLLAYGAANALAAILATGLVIVAAGWPISRAAARHGLDMDLLTRGAGFGYLGSTVTSLVYASFTFVFFALEAAVMAFALELAFGLPPAWGYLACALVVLPLVMHGVTAMSRLQVWTQPLWIVLLVLPYAFVLAHHPGLVADMFSAGGPVRGHPRGLDALGFGAALTVGVALITQMGEQADTLRFMPPPASDSPRARRRWTLAVAAGGIGWVLPGVLKMAGGALLATLALQQGVSPERAVDPNRMYLAAWREVLPAGAASTAWAVAVTALFVVVSQLKINVTNAYAGSLAWSNFFSRLTHHHPGRVVWVVFNTAIALMLMELDVFQALGRILGLYANVAIAWLMAVVADLVVNKPLGLSPPGIEFRRAYLYDVNTVGTGAMAIASTLGIAAHLGAFGPMAQAWSAMISMVTALVASPLIAWATKGRYYLARPAQPAAASTDDDGARLRPSVCCICERPYEGPDMSHCPAYRGPICSLCCSLDARCGDLCKPHARAAAQWRGVTRRLLPRRLWRPLRTPLAEYLTAMAVLTAGLGALFLALHQQVLASIASFGEGGAALAPVLQRASLEAFVVLLLVTGVATWWAVLTHRSRRVAQQESNRQTQALNAQALALRREIASHQQTDAQLQQATRAAESANQAKSRYIASISHELRTPLNSIIGYAELVAEDPAVPAHRRQAVEVIRRAGDHLLSLIEGTLDLARIEGGRVSVDPRPMRLVDTLRTLADLFELQASTKALRFVTDFDPGLPEVVRGDEKRLRQVLINVIGNAVKFTQAGQVRLRATHARELAVFEVEDTGPGMSEEELARIFEPFERGRTTAGGSGLGLTIAKMLADLMGGELTVRSRPGEGTCFRLRLFLPALPPGTPVDPVVPFPAAAVATATSADRPLLPLPSTDMMQSPPPNLTPPARSALESLIEPVRLGWLRGVERGLDRLVADAPDTEAYANRLRQMARRFELAALEREIREALDRAGCHDG